MKYFATVFLIVTACFLGNSQTYEVGGLLGGSNYIGDIGRTNYISPNSLAFGGIFKWNRSERHSFRGTIMVAGISGDDADASDVRRQQRGYSFKNTITELSVGLEYTFWEFNLHKGEPQSAPYLYTGITYFLYDAVFKPLGSTEVVKYDTAGSFAVPMVVGYKTSIGTRFVLGMEIGARYTFTDGLDGSNPEKGGVANEPAFKFGNTNSDDWYVFTGVTFTVMFGRQPCYCNF